LCPEGYQRRKAALYIAARTEIQELGHPEGSLKQQSSRLMRLASGRRHAEDALPLQKDPPAAPTESPESSIRHAQHAAQIRARRKSHKQGCDDPFSCLLRRPTLCIKNKMGLSFDANKVATIQEAQAQKTRSSTFRCECCSGNCFSAASMASALIRNSMPDSCIKTTRMCTQLFKEYFAGLSTSSSALADSSPDHRNTSFVASFLRHSGPRLCCKRIVTISNESLTSGFED
jgi:hypothetical protein